jgi:hypothetical protein
VKKQNNLFFQAFKNLNTSVLFCFVLLTDEAVLNDEGCCPCWPVNVILKKPKN